MKKGLLVLVIAGIIFTALNSQMATADSVVYAAEPSTKNEATVSEVYVNPLYRDVLSEDDLLSVPDYGIAVYAEPEYETNEENIVSQIRWGMTNRQSVINVYYASQNDYDDTLLKKWFKLATEETDDSHEGDYLHWNYGGYKVNINYRKVGEITYFDYNINVFYYTTAEQEKELDAAIDEQIIKLGLNQQDVSDYEKVKKVYDFVCSNISYDYENLNDDTYLLKYTAYAALIDKKAVCQGYAALMYRMLENAGIDTRIISGTTSGGPHGWNMVKMGSRYYYLDSTWDAGKSNYGYFLKGKKDFPDHVVDSGMLECVNSYPLSENNYAVTKIILDKTSLELKQQGSAQLKVEFQPEGTGSGEKVQWSSSDINTVTVDSEGKVTAVAPGKAVITAKAAGRIAKCVVNVTESILELPADQWVQNSKGWWYKRADGSYPRNGWSRIDGKWYYFDVYGYRVTGWKAISGKWYYMDPSTGIMQTGWINTGGKSYYLSPSGDMKTGWQLIDGKWYYLNSSGVRTTGWIRLGGRWYFMDPSTGIMQTGWIKTGGKNYYLSSSGDMKTGWQSINGKWYYLNPSDGARTEGWRMLGTVWYYFEPDTGIMYANQWLNNVYYLRASGAMAVGWTKIDGKWYYFNNGGYKLKNRWLGNYYLKGDGSMAVNEWVDGGRYYVNNNGIWVPNKAKG